jgi:hypothetical protein
MNYAHYFNSRFSACRVLAYAYDQHRERDVTIYQIPGKVDVVGVSDTVDRWIAPVAPELFSINIQQLFRDMQSGVELKLPIYAPRPGAAQNRGRRALISDDHVVSSPADPGPGKRRPSKSAPSARRVLL